MGIFCFGCLWERTINRLEQNLTVKDIVIRINPAEIEFTGKAEYSKGNKYLYFDIKSAILEIEKLV